MVEAGDDAPDFTVSLANGDIEEFTLSERLDEAPIVLAFFPGAFTEVCTHEMNAFQDRLDRFDELGATVYGVSVDSPFVLNEFRDRLGVDFGLLSDANHELVERYGVSIPFADFGIDSVADRVTFVVDGDGRVAYKDVTDNPGVEPDYDAVEDAVADAA